MPKQVSGRRIVEAGLEKTLHSSQPLLNIDVAFNDRVDSIFEGQTRLDGHDIRLATKKSESFHPTISGQEDLPLKYIQHKSKRSLASLKPQDDFRDIVLPPGPLHFIPRRQ